MDSRETTSVRSKLVTTVLALLLMGGVVGTDIGHCGDSGLVGKWVSKRNESYRIVFRSNGSGLMGSTKTKWEVNSRGDRVFITRLNRQSGTMLERLMSHDVNETLSFRVIGNELWLQRWPSPANADRPGIRPSWDRRNRYGYSVYTRW